MNPMLTQPITLIGAIITQGTSTEVLGHIEPDYILATEFLTVRNEQTKGVYYSWEDMDLLKVIVPAEYAEQVFEELYTLAKIEQTEGAYIYQHSLTGCSDYQLPVLPAEGIPTEALEDMQLANELGLSETDIQNLKRLVENQT
ncbi:hypothetical protein P8S54_04515 [Thiomicrospira sp. R3]|uniref:hypothetical protein n=1 Tax=Thiomicrospira sp. R3 TaxID=3035472 RepID=UPI00259B9CA3|nr:hypothetical protein [Thiomicrospira sp. R3]WFE69569.1 hypothetical protein P8S54_04515 [Thiomicrospira sp. R3]